MGANKILRKSSMQRRMLYAFIDLAILSALKNHSMTAYGINNYFLEKIGASASPSVVYTELIFLERKGLIKCAEHNNGRVYTLTELGTELTGELGIISAECKCIINRLLLS